LFAALITLLSESRTNMLAFFVEVKPIAVLHKQCNKLLNELVGHFGLRKGDLLAAALALSLHGSEAQS
jgi:hypothetical protein